ncbi:hypothetical protein GB937_008363 [Aspergillus fischeri]|nr:hypothetical protein GB937_008363 [Aspergillus fischeri]
MGGLVNQTAFNDTFDSPDSTMIGVIVSLMEIGAFLGSVSSAFFGERIGRRKSIAVGVVILILGALLQATAYHRSHLIVGRVVSGVGLGVVNSTVPVMQVEFSPKATRGLYVCMQLSTVHFGILVADWIDYGSSTHTGSYAWRVPVILQCTFPFLMLFFVFLMDETAPWFAAHNRQDQDLQVLRQLYNDNMHESDITALHEVALEKAVGAGSWKDLLRNDEIQSQRRFLIAYAILIFQPLGGINAIIYYSATLFEESVGFSKYMSALTSGFLQTWFFVASFNPWFLIDRVGRHPLLLSMISLMAAVMACVTLRRRGLRM